MFSYLLDPSDQNLDPEKHLLPLSSLSDGPACFLFPQWKGHHRTSGSCHLCPPLHPLQSWDWVSCPHAPATVHQIDLSSWLLKNMPSVTASRMQHPLLSAYPVTLLLSQQTVTPVFPNYGSFVCFPFLEEPYILSSSLPTLWAFSITLPKLSPSELTLLNSTQSAGLNLIWSSWSTW